MTFSPKKPPYLSVLKGSSTNSGDGDGENPSRVISAEQFTPEMSAAVQRFIKGAELKGVITGALLGDAVWDVRPLILIDGQVQILRFLDPSLAFQSDNYSKHKAYLEKIKKIELIIAYGEFEEQAWYLRRFYNSTLADSTDLPTLASVNKIIDQLRQIHKIGLVHGHLSPHNIGLDQGEIILLDPGTCIFSGSSRISKQDLAPELQGGFQPSFATDIYGLGVILKYIFDSDKKNDFNSFLNSLINTDPARRPTIQWVQDSLQGKFHNRHQFGSVPVQNSTSIVTQNFNRHNFLFLILLSLLCLSLYIVISNKFVEEPVAAVEESIPVDNYWLSDQPSLMKKVAMAAIKDDSESARYVIVRNALQNKQFQGVLNHVIKVAFDPRWESTLTAEDRKVVFKIALGGLLTKEERATPFRRDLNPAVILALVSSVDVNTEGAEFSGFSVDYLTRLPSPIKEAFKKLSELGVKNMEEKPAKGLSHLLTGNLSNAAIEAYLLGFSSPKSSEEIVSLIKLIQPITDKFPLVKQNIFEILTTKDNDTKQLFKWFIDGELGVWETVSSEKRLDIIANSLKDNFSTEQLCDLLAFPDKNISKNALLMLKNQKENADIAAFLDVVAGYATSMKRAELISLISIIKLGQDKNYPLIQKWFKSSPDPQMVANLLISRRKSSETDSFTFEASRYLSTNAGKLKFNINELKQLVAHPEPMVRAVAYSHLKPSVPEELLVLKSSVKVEPNARMRKDIEDRLQLSAE